MPEAQSDIVPEATLLKMTSEILPLAPEIATMAALHISQTHVHTLAFGTCSLSAGRVMIKGSG